VDATVVRHVVIEPVTRLVRLCFPVSSYSASNTFDNAFVNHSS